MQYWCQKSSEDVRNSFERKEGSGRRRSSRCEESVELVRSYLNDYNRLTCEEIESLTSIPRSTVYRIIVEDLEMKSITGKWIPHILKEEHKEQRVECAKAMIDSLTESYDIKRRLLIVD